MPSTQKPLTQSLSQAEWKSRADAHRQRVKKWSLPYRKRRSLHQAHPVHDFLFTYYNYSLSKLETWHPSIEFTVKEIKAPPLPTEKRLKSLRWIRNLLAFTAARSGNFSCYGMHEWAMVYRGHEVRHEASTTLRLSRAEIDTFVESRPICCSHYDAFRFFSPEARSFNKLQPTLEDRPDNEQPACLHANMDLYKWAYKSMPWIGSDLLMDCFDLALDIRSLDMRASPYDLLSYGYEPIKIETAAGRETYESLQRQHAKTAAHLRQQLIEALDLINIRATKAL